MPPIRSTSGYAAQSRALAAQYESVSFEAVHAAMLHHFPRPPLPILDIGAGSGRDAAALAQRGHRVLAVEPVKELRQEGQRLHAGEALVWLDDALPELQAVRALGERYALILLSGVWMHLEEEARRRAMPYLADLLTLPEAAHGVAPGRPGEAPAGGGKIILSLRHGLVPEGRQMFAVSAQETVSLALSCGLRLAEQIQCPDVLGRADVHWSMLCLEKKQGAG